ncbi:hypothetical protein RFI_37413, partial [Reticulomyxa filosa]
NGYTICSGSFDETIRIWDVETAKQLNMFERHKNWIRSVKYGSNEFSNTILSVAHDKSVRLWDTRSSQQIGVFNGHEGHVYAADYSPFVMKNSNKVICSNSDVICSVSYDKTIRFWDIRSNKNELYIMKVGAEVTCLKFILKKEINNKKKLNGNCCVNLCYGSSKGPIYLWG